MKVVLLVVTMASLTLSQTGFEAADMPVCLSTCMTPFPANHAGDTCTSPWITSIEACIDRSCSTSISTTTSTRPNTDTRTTVFFSPKKMYSCQQSFVPGADQSSPNMQLQAGICAVSPYVFQSFVMTWGQNGGQDNCTLEVSDGVTCYDSIQVVDLEVRVMSGQCQFVGGQSVMLNCGDGAEQGLGLSDNQAARNYLASFCPYSDPQSSDSTQSVSGTQSSSISSQSSGSMFSSTTLAMPSSYSVNSTMTTTFVDPAPTNTITWSNTTTTTSFADPPNKANISMHSSSVVIPVVPVSGPMAGSSSESEKSVKRNGAAQWALVVVVFSRSLMY